jgi:PRC-barrel domain protein
LKASERLGGGDTLILVAVGCIQFPTKRTTTGDLMPRYRTLRDFHFPNAAEDIRGAELFGENADQANRDRLGVIADVVFDPDTSKVIYVVVDTGGWLKSNRFLVPADHIFPMPDNPQSYLTDLTRAWIERFPEYNEKYLDSVDLWADYEGKYRAAWPQPGEHEINDKTKAAAQTTSEFRKRWQAFEERLRQSQDEDRDEVA